MRHVQGCRKYGSNRAMFRPIISFGHWRRRGSVASLVAITLPVLIGVSALGLDAGLLYVQRRQAQTAAEGIATAAAYQLYLSSSNTSGASAAAKALATHYGVSSPTISIPPTSGTYANKSGYVQVSVTTSSPRLFSAIWGAGSMSVAASATARAGGSQPLSPASLIVLDPSGSGALTVTGGSNLKSTGAVQVNSSSPTAVNVNNGADINAAVNIVGGKTVAAGSAINGTVTSGVSSVNDPFSSIATPSAPSATTTPLSGYKGYGAFTMQPGLYSGSVSLGNGGTFTMQPGLYYIQGGNFSIANGATLSGSGVTIYIDNTNVSGTSSPGTINFQGGTTSTLTAPTSGTYQGMVYFQNRSSATTPQFGNGATIKLTGAFYAPDASLTFTGGTSTNQLSNQMVAKDVSISNGATVNIPYNSANVPSTTGSFAVVQ
jgi:Flp pilus assembly protein TadG